MKTNHRNRDESSNFLKNRQKSKNQPKTFEKIHQTVEISTNQLTNFPMKILTTSIRKKK